MTTPTVTTEVALASLPAASPTWTNLSAYVEESAGSSASRSNELDTFSPGARTVILKNTDGRFNPNNTAGAYYGNLLPERRFRQTAGYLAEVFADVPTYYWRLGQRTSDRVTGAMCENRRRTGTYTNSPTLSAKDGPFFGAGYVFFAFASSQYIDTGDLSVFEAGATTYEAWFKTTDSGANNCIFSEGLTASANGASSILLDSTGRVVARFQNDAGGAFSRNSGTSYNDGAWHHVVMTRSGTTVKLYVDGVQKGADLTISGTYTQDNSRIGTLASSPEYMDGYISELAVYPSVLSAARVLQHYTAATTVGGGYLMNGYVKSWKPRHDYPADSVCELAVHDGAGVLSLAPTASSPYEIEVRSDSPAAWWRMADNEGETYAVDAIGTADAIYEGGPTGGGLELVAGQSLPSTYFEADAKSRAQYTSTTGTPLTGYPWTVEAVMQIEPSYADLRDRWVFWVYPYSAPSFGIQIFVHGDSDPAYNGHIGVFCNSSGQTRAAHSTKGVADNRPHHIAVVAASASSILIYVDGVDCTSVDLSGTPTFPAASLGYTIGGRQATYGATTGGLGGYLAEAAVYNSALSAARVLSHYNAFATAWKADTTGGRTARLADRASWSSSGRQISVGQSTMQAAKLSGSVHSAMQQAAETESGALFVRPDLVLEFWDRHTLNAAPYNVSVADLTDQSTGINYENVEADFAVDDIKNYVTVSRDGGAPQVAQDTTSQGKYFKRVFEKSGLQLQTDGEARDFAYWYLNRYKNPSYRFGKVTLTPYGAETSMFPIMLGLKLGDRVTVAQKPPGESVATEIDAHVTGITHTVGPGVAWRTELQLNPVDSTNYFVLDSSLLDGAAVLSY